LVLLRVAAIVIVIICNFNFSVVIVPGLITSFDVNRQLCWLALGTSKGAHICWDMRFQLPVTTVLHPTGNVSSSIALYIQLL